MVTDVFDDVASQRDDTVNVGSTQADIPIRQRLLHLLTNVPMFMDAVRKMSAGDVFRVAISKENIQFFKPNADGVYKPYLHNGKHFVENVELIRASPDYVGTLTDVALMVNMAAIAAKLEAIEIAVRDMKHLMADTHRGRVKGALDALALARDLAKPAERREHTIAASRDVVIELGALTGQLRAHIGAMPKETTGLFDVFGRTWLMNANKAYEQVLDDISLLIDGVSSLVRTYQDLGEFAVARAAFGRIVDGIKQGDLPDAIRKARLLPFSAAAAPEACLNASLNAFNDMGMQLLRIEQPKEAAIVMDIQPEELVN